MGARKQYSLLKNHTIGFEVEFFVLDKQGRVVPHADTILKKLQEKRELQNSMIVKEATKNIIELGSYPSITGTDTMLTLLKNLKILVSAASEVGLYVCPLGTYPGKFMPLMRNNANYRIQKKFFGKKRFSIAGRVAGFHCHYAMPWGVYDSKKFNLKKLTNSKNQASLVNSFKFLVAADPALATFTQSSPFYQGLYLAKDSRMLVYRGGEDLNYPNGLYASLPLLGQLPRYPHTGLDISHNIQERYEEWMELLREKGIPKEQIPKYESILQTNWAPVRINFHGTLEQRGMDMNHLPILLGMSIIIQKILSHIQEEYFQVLPLDIAIKEPFKLTKKTILIPPYTYLKKELQKLSAYKGLESNEIYTYCKRLIGLVKKLEGEKINGLIRPLEEMLENRKTVSDNILDQAKALGHKNFQKPLPIDIAAQIALEHSKKIFEEIVLLQKAIEERKK